MEIVICRNDQEVGSVAAARVAQVCRQAGAEAVPLVDALLDRAAEIGPVRAFGGLSFNRRLRAVPPEITLTSYGAMGELRMAPGLQVVPAHYSTLPRLFAERALPGDVGLVQVSPPGPDGVCSFGIGVDYVADAARHSRVRPCATHAVAGPPTASRYQSRTSGRPGGCSSSGPSSSAPGPGPGPDSGPVCGSAPRPQARRNPARVRSRAGRSTS